MNISTKGKGSVSVTPDSTSYSVGTIVSLTAIPDSGEQFIEWGGDLIGSENSKQITMNSNKHVSATFTSNTTRVTEEFIVEKIESQSGEFEGVWNARATADLVDGVIGLSQGYPEEYSHLSCKILFANTGELKVSNGSSFSAEQTVTYSANQNFVFRMNVNVNSQIYSVWITPEGKDEILLANMYQFHPGPGTVESFNYRSVKMSFDDQWGGAEGMVEISDFDIKTGFDSQSSNQKFPVHFSLACYPNPFNPKTTIRFVLPKSGSVKLFVFDAAGRKVAELIDGYKHAGMHSLTWSAKDANGLRLASGMYIYQMKYDRQILAGKVILVR